MLNIIHPPGCSSERDWIYHVLLNEFLGIEYTESEGQIDHIRIENEGRVLELADTFFSRAQNQWLKPESLPILPLAIWDTRELPWRANLASYDLPIIYGNKSYEISEYSVRFGLDVFGSAFFMLSRYEELVTKVRDEYDRFPATASVAYKAGFLNRPIINEYLEILWACMHALWPDLQRKNRKFRKLVSCDVDHPFDLAGYSLKKTILRVGSRIIRKKNVSLALVDALNYIFKIIGSDRFDQYRNNIDWMMDLNRRAGNKVAFYFIPKQTSKSHEDANDITSSKLTGLIKNIASNGHEVGFHPGYNTYKCSKKFTESSDIFKSALRSAKVNSSKIGGRQHYLRYDIAHTPQLWEANGFDYDSSLGFADRAGFRCGVCYEYSMYDLTSRKAMRLKQRPLIVMECTIIAKQYEGLGYTKRAIERFEYFKSACEKFNGDYTLLWHNSSFSEIKSTIFYNELIGKSKSTVDGNK